MRRIWLLMVMGVAAMVVSLSGCNRETRTDSTRLQVVTTLFPLYDFARTIAGDRAEVTMLLPPGMEPHSFEPKPNDIVRIGRAGLFVYTSPYMEPWAELMLKGIDRKGLRVVNAGNGVRYASGFDEAGHNHAGHGEHGAAEHAGSRDPHIWLDFENAVLIVNNLLSGFTAADPVNAPLYRENAAGLIARLKQLDLRYHEALSSCGTRVFLHGGHFTFGYLARRYGLEYRSLSGISSESEPSAARMAAMVRQIRSSRVRYLFAEELLSPRLTETLASEAGVAVLKLHGAHNLGKDDLERGASFISLMEQNLVNLQKGLACQSK